MIKEFFWNHQVIVTSKKMYSFEGDYRRKPQQNLAGASKRNNEKSVLLQHAHFERMKREEYRRQNNAALKIQAHLRSFSTRQVMKKESRCEFDKAKAQVTSKYVPVNSLGLYVRNLLFFYDADTDSTRFVWLLEQILANEKQILESHKQWLWNIKWILKHCMKFIVSNSSNRSSFIPLRVLETFIMTSDGSIQGDKREVYLKDVLKYLVQNSYFKHIKQLLEEQVSSTSQLTPRIQCFLNLMKRPLEFCAGCDDFFVPVLSEFASSILIPRISDTLQSILISSLLEMKNLPFVELLSCINRCKINEPTTNLFYTILSLEPADFYPSTEVIFVNYFQVLASLRFNQNEVCDTIEISPEDLQDDDSISSDNDIVMTDSKEAEVLKQCIAMLNDEQRVNRILSALERNDSPLVLNSLCRLCDHLLQTDKLAGHKYKLLYMLAFKPTFLRRLWSALVSMPLLQTISQGIAPNYDEARTQIASLLAVFCSLFSLLIATLHDSEFFMTDHSQFEKSAMPFTVNELVPLSAHLKDVCLGLVEIAFSDARRIVRDDYKCVLTSISDIDERRLKKQDAKMWMHLFTVTAVLLRQLNTRDLRRQFCPEGHWISPKPELDSIWHKRRESVGGLLRTDIEDSKGPPLTMKEIRALTLLKKVPFIVSFSDRFLILQSLIQKDKLEQQGELTHFMQGPSIQISVRRDYLYEDSLVKLAPDNEPEMRLKMRVQFVNNAGAGEAGVDGGGVFREFLSELLKTSFDPNRGFFKLTKDNMLYPNPTVHLLVDDFLKHYYFIGRMIGKAIYESLLVDLPFAEFFLSKIVGKQSDVDIHHLNSLDPLMYRNLLYLKSYKGDVTELGLDFTVLSDELGERRVEELKPKGAQIPVTNSNRIEYIHLMADYKLNKEIRQQCQAFKQGIANVIPLDWLQMFNNKEMQVLISGDQNPIDVNDLKQHTNYTGGYTLDHPTIVSFWRVVEAFSNKQKGQLLKFVTSCSRPPLLGFKELDPPFCIQHAGTVDRLPTSSTCMNLLKLPEFPNEVTLREKLIYAIQAGAGFELS